MELRRSLVQLVANKALSIRNISIYSQGASIIGVNLKVPGVISESGTQDHPPL